MRSPWRVPHAERRKASAPRSRGVAQATSSVARCRARSINERQRLLVWRGNGWMRPALRSLFCRRGTESFVVPQSSDAHAPRECTLFLIRPARNENPYRASFCHTRMLRPSRPSVKFFAGADVMVSVSPSSL